MASFKFSAIICALFVLQAQAYPQQEAAVGSILDTIKQVVTSIEKVVDNGLDLGINALEKAIDYISAFPDQSKESVKTLIDAVGKLIDARLDKLNGDVNDDAKAAIACLVKNKDELRAAEVNFLENLGACGNKEVADLLSAIRAIINDLKTVQASVKEAASGIDACDGKSDVETLGCLVDVARKVIGVAINIPDSIKVDVQKVVQLFKDNLPKVRECAKTTAHTFYTNDVIKIVNQIATCTRTA